MGCTGLQQEEAVAVTLANAMLPQHSLPRCVISAYSGVEVAKDDELFRPGHRRDGGSQILSFTSSGLVMAGA